jgi:DNA-binding beta-propeller fold protein YncE
MESFQCPKCGAPVSYNRDVVGANLTAQCPYCHSALSVPNSRDAQSTNINIHLGPPGSVAKASKWIWLILIIPLLGVVVVVAAVLVLIAMSRKPDVPDTPRSVIPPTTTRPTPGNKNKALGFAKVILTFGSEGIGPGMFKDARSIAVDASGKIYVGEYTGGRVQVFNPEGEFITQWSVDTKMPLTGMAVDRNGIIYAVQSGTISRYEGTTGNLLGKVAYSEGWGFNDLRIAADGGLVASWYKNRDDIVRFNSTGQATRTIRAAISSVTDRPELDTQVAVDGLGNIYALGTFNNAVFKFAPDGKYQTKFGSDGDQAGQFRAPSAIAVDGKGRVFVSDFKGIQVFDGNGRYLTVFNPEGHTFGMSFNDANELFVTNGKQVLKLAISD